MTLKAVFQESQKCGREGTPHFTYKPWPVSKRRDLQQVFDVESRAGLKKYDEYSKATCCWYGASNQRAVFTSECFSVYGQQSMSPSWILNAYQRRWQARGQKAAQVAAVLCSIRPQRSTEPLTSIPKSSTISIEHCVSPCTAISLHYIYPQTAESGTSGQPQSAADWPPSFIGPDKEPPLQESKRGIKRANRSMPSLKIELKHKLNMPDFGNPSSHKISRWFLQQKLCWNIFVFLLFNILMIWKKTKWKAFENKTKTMMKCNNFHQRIRTTSQK